MSTDGSESNLRERGMEARLRALGLPVSEETVEWARKVELSETKVPAVLEPMGMTKDEARDVAYADKRSAKGDSPLAQKRRRLARIFDTAA